MAQEASVIIYDLMVEAETSYSSGAQYVPAEDGITVAALPEFTINYALPGDRPAPQGTEGKIKRSAPGGRTIEGTITAEVAGAAVAYSTASFPPLHDLIQAAGFSASFESSTIIYKRNSIDTAYSFASILFARDTYRTLIGGLADLSFTLEAGGTGMAEFSVVGIAGVPVASGTIPSITHADINPPIGTNVQLTLNGSSSFCVRSMAFNLQRDVSTNRLNANSAAGTCGFAIGRIDPTLTVVLEANPGYFDAYAFREAATEFAASLTVGDTQYNTYTFSFPTCTIMEVNEQDDGPVAIWEIVLDIHNSLPGLRDDIVWTFS